MAKIESEYEADFMAWFEFGLNILIGMCFIFVVGAVVFDLIKTVIN